MEVAMEMQQMDAKQIWQQQIIAEHAEMYAHQEHALEDNARRQEEELVEEQPALAELDIIAALYQESIAEIVQVALLVMRIIFV